MNEFKKSYNDMISLDQYIQENMADDQVCMIDRPKHRLDPDEEAKLRAQLDNDLKGQNIKLQEHYKNYSKFDRLEDRNSDEDEDDRYETQSTLTMFSEDVVMRDLNSSKQNFHEIEEIQQDDLHLCRIKQPFRTLESKIGAHGDSQSWRLDRENALGKRPQNMPYLTTSKNRNNNMNSRTHNGRIRKPKTRQNGSIYLTHENKNPDNNMNSRTQREKISNPKTRQKGSIYLTYEDENPDKILNIQTRTKRLRVEAPEPVFAAPQAPSSFPASTSAQQSGDSSNLMIRRFIEGIRNLTDYMSASLSPAGQPVPVAQPVIPPQTPMYNSSTGFPVQEPKAEPNSYLEYLNRKHNIAPDSQRPLVHYDDDNCGFGLPQTTIPRYS